VTKKDLINNMSRTFNLKKKEAKALVNFVFEAVREALKRGEEVSIPKFGKFSLKPIPKKNVKLPNGKRVEIPPRKKVVFVPYSKFLLDNTLTLERMEINLRSEIKGKGRTAPTHPPIREN